jgi:hypothetical protein
LILTNLGFFGAEMPTFVKINLSGWQPPRPPSHPRLGTVDLSAPPRRCDRDD